MAHLAKLHRKCGACSKAATFELFNSSNGSLGVFCTSCGRRRLAEIERSEKAAKPW